MVRCIQRKEGGFEIGEAGFLNSYYEAAYKGIPYAHIHIQLIVAHNIAYCHVTFKRFSSEIAKEVVKDWAEIKENMRAAGIKDVAATKEGGTKLWKKFLKLAGFKADDVFPIIIKNKPCMMAIMEI